MATISLTNATRQTMATKFASEMNRASVYAFGMRATTVGHYYRYKSDFLSALSFIPGENPFVDDKLGKTKVVWAVYGHTVVIKNSLGNDTELPLLVVYENYARDTRYFRDLVFAQNIGEPEEYARVLMTYQVLPSERPLVDPVDYGVTYVQEFEVTF